MGDPIKPKAESPITVTMTESEFKAHVAAAAQKAATEAAAAAIAQFATTQPGASSSTDAQSLLEGLALAIAQISHQGDKRDAPVDPKVLAERRAATERMQALILEAKALPKGDPRRPKYKTRSKQNLNDVMIDPYKRDPATRRAVPVEFRWCLEPNDAMVPLNEMANKIYAEFRASRGNKAEYLKEQQKQAWLTDGGLLIEGAPPARREIASTDYERDGDLDIDTGEGPNDPNATHVHVLGTAHPAARQNHHGEL